MHNEKKNDIKRPNMATTEPEILRAAKEGMPLPGKNDAIEQNINNREYGVEYGMDTTGNMNVENKCGCKRDKGDKKDEKKDSSGENGSGNVKNGAPRVTNSAVNNAVNSTAERSRTNKGGDFAADPSEMRKAPGYNGSVPGVNTPEIRLPGAEMKQDVSVPAFNPPVPNRAWTAMRKGMDIEELSEEERRDLYIGRDRYF